MTAPIRHLPQVIHVDNDKCVNCHACIAACPVKTCNDGSGAYVNLNADKCIACGRCLAACTHGARYYSDDFSQFMDDIALGRPMVAVVAPSAVANFGGGLRHLTGWLKALGVEAVFDVTMGAELCVRAYAEHFKRSAPRMVIAQPCAAIVTYIQVHRPELLPHLAPIDSPMLHTMKTVRRNFPRYVGHRMVVISPCPAKKREFVETGWGDYNVTYASIQKYLESNGLVLESFPAADFELPSPDVAALFPIPGGLVEALERWLPEVRHRVRTIQGQESVYKYLAALPEAIRSYPESVPVLIDCLNCPHGCSCGPASLHPDQGLDAVECRVRRRHWELREERGDRAGDGIAEFERMLEQYLAEGDYARQYANLSAGSSTRVPSGEERLAILRSMHKYTEKDLYNCCSCGYGSCDDMCVAIHNGWNRPENCHHYLAKETQLSQEQLSEYRDRLENLVEARTAELTNANERLRQEVVDRIRAEDALEDARHKLADVVQGSPIPQFGLDKDHRVFYWNKAIEELTKIKAEQVVGTREHWKAFYDKERPCLVDLLLDDDEATIDSLYEGRCHKSTLLNGAYAGSGFFPKFGEEEKWVYFTAAVIKDAKGAVVGAVETLEDITERRRTEVQLARSQQAAESANRAKSEFLANMSHEIRTPMTAIMGYIDLLAEGCARRCVIGDSRLGDPLEVISQNARHLLQLIDDVLDLSKVEAGKLLVDRTAVSPCGLLADVASLMRARAVAKGLALEFEYQGPMPETIQSDSTRLRQILINIIGNAIKFTDAGGVRVTVGLRETERGPQLQIEVRDTGIGISEEFLGRLFTPFVQADASTSRRFGGTGLGLTISKRLAELLGGDIVARSVPRVGSTFTLTVPAGPLNGVRLLQTPSEVCPGSQEDAPKPATATRSLPAHCRLLLVEDGPDNQRLIAHLLRKAGAEVALAENGQTALELALAARSEERPFDVLLMDMQMPVMDGYEATGRLRAAGYTGPIIALTAHAMKDDRDKCLAVGCNDYVSKPIDRGRLLDAVSRHLAARPIAAQAER